MALADVLDRLERTLRPAAPHDRPTGPLFHYTDATAFHSIFTRKAIWATDFRYLNDAQEVRIGEGCFSEVVVDLVGSATERQRFILREILAAHDRDSLSRVLPPCVASFSTAPDLLSQWRAYAAGGAGYSIGFSAFPLPTAPLPGADLALWLIECEYQVAPFQAKVRSALLSLLAEYERAVTDHVVDAESDALVNGAFVALALQHAASLVPRLKHAAFAEEREWRLLLFPSPARAHAVVKYRATPAGLKPYIELPLASETEGLQVARVVVGPTQHPERGLLATRGFLQHLGYDPAIVQASEVPFRG